MSLRAMVATNLRVVRRQKGFTQEELADLAGVNRNYVGQIEREEKSPTVDVIEKLAFSLEIAPEVLFRNPRRNKR
jgi:transcriptional regulator with XRE-family HTH domain